MPESERVYGTLTNPFEVVENVPNPDSFIGDHPATQLLDGVTNSVRLEFRVPNDFRQLVRAYIEVVPAASGNMDRALSATWGRWCTEAYNNHVDAVAAGVVAVVANLINCIDISAALTGIAANDEVGITLTRRGGDVGDTVNATVYVLKIVMQYIW